MLAKFGSNLLGSIGVILVAGAFLAASPVTAGGGGGYSCGFQGSAICTVPQSSGGYGCSKTQPCYKSCEGKRCDTTQLPDPYCVCGNGDIGGCGCIINQ